jgi:Ca2+-binding EF-hand superfamily protein
MSQISVLKDKFNSIASRGKWETLTRKTGLINRKRFVDFYVDFFMDGDSRTKKRTKTNPTPYACLMFDTLDDKEDEEANIDFHEFVYLIKLHVSATKNERIMWIYRLHDNDESGFIDEDEFVHVARYLGCESVICIRFFRCMKETVGTFSKECEGKVRREFREIAVRCSARNNSKAIIIQGEDDLIDKDEFLASDYVLNCPIYKSLSENPLFSHARN